MGKCQVVKYFLTDGASLDVETHTFPDGKWETFKQYLINRYILDKRMTIMNIKKGLDNLTLSTSVNSLYSQIRESMSLLTFLEPDMYKNCEELIIQKLISSI